MDEIYFPLLKRNRIDSVLYYGAPEGGVDGDFGEIQERLDRVSHSVLVFTSHVFEVPYAEELREYLKKNQTPFWVQLSLGAEFSDHADRIAFWRGVAGFRGIEILTDRKMGPIHMEQIRSLPCDFRFVCVPRPDLRPVEFLRDFPREWSSRVTVYFPKKMRKTDRCLSNDEIFILITKLRDLRPDLSLSPANHLEKHHEELFQESAAEREFRRSPSGNALLELHSQRGVRGKIKSIILEVAKRRVVFPVLVLPYGFFWLFHDPLAAISSVFRFFRHPIKAGYKVYDLLVWCGYRFVEFLYVLRHWAIMIHVYLWRVKSLLVRLGIQAFYRAKVSLHRLMILFYFGVLYRIYFGLIHSAAIRVILFLKNPRWYLRMAFPRTYWLISFPPKKIYWFLLYQYRKRILKFGTK